MTEKPMTPDELIALRKSFAFTQTTMAGRLGMSYRAYSDLETGKAQIRQVHAMAVECLAIRIAAETGELSRLPRTAIEVVAKLRTLNA